jgi:hypothetical protein
MEVLIDTSSEVSAKAVVRGASPGQTMRFQWVVYDGNQEYFQVPGSRRELDLFALGPYSGKALGLKVTVGNKTYLSKNRVDLMGVDKNDFRRETLEAKKPGLGLLGTPIVRRLHFSYETYRIGCKKRTVISTNTIGSGFQEETCDYRNRPKEFTVEQLAVLRAAAISVYKTLRLEQVNATTKALERPVETCVKSLANMSHGEFNLVPDVTLPYTLDNVFGVYNKQVSRWSGITNVQDFRIHIMVNDNNSANPLVLGHASLGAVRADFDHVKLANADGDRFEVHVNNRYLPATTTSAPTNVPLTVDGKNYSIEISMKALAETIAHEMMHQMGISHTQNSGGADFQDDFVYSLGQCVNRNHVAQYDWNDVVAF